MVLRKICAVSLRYEGDIIDEIDTELHLTIGQIRQYLQNNFNLRGVQLYFRGLLLNNDAFTLADYDWTNGMCEEIEVRTWRGNQRLVIRT